MPNKYDFRIDTYFDVCGIPITQIAHADSTYYLYTDINGKEELAFEIFNVYVDYDSMITMYKQNQQDIGRLFEYILALIKENKQPELPENNADFSISKT